MKRSVAVLGFVYPGVEEYIDQYFKSLSEQTYKDFDVLIYNDGMSDDFLSKYIALYSELNIYVYTMQQRYTIAQIREIAINNIKNEYSFLIFTDTDDFFSNNRIEKCVEKLNNYDFCYNNMILVDKNGVKLDQYSYFERKDNPIVVDNFLQLLNKNFCGLSNSAINLLRVNLDFLHIPANIIAVDWWIYSVLLLKGYTGGYIYDTFTFYRQYENNCVGGLSLIDELYIKKAISVKKDHYTMLLKNYTGIFDDLIKNELNKIIELEMRLTDMKEMRNYISNINKSKKEYMWWENIK